MYVIYINDRPLALLSKTEHRTGALAPEVLKSETHLTAMYSGKPRTLLHYADMLEKGSPKVTSVAMVAEDLDVLWKDFQSHYRWLPAAGGIVRNRELNKHLFIFRRDFWDLPKGKIDKGEDEPTAALREVEEETGVSDLTLGKALPTTYHTYRNRKEKRVLKPTYWFEMETSQSVLVPQEEEDIEIATWRTIEEVVTGTDPIYKSLLWLLNRV
ncbi:MAG: 8-oxo-dGTP pyrophosphatase MutT (NUDIX family) [Neolewinella sp.]|jgi:8-oxo-dGTP pyrophosphatase MutT (NUDIX family)